MAAIDIHHPHTLGLEQARSALDDVARKLGERFQFESKWVGDTLHFNRSGVDGQIALAADAVQVKAKLGMMLSMLQGPIEAEIRRVLQEKFG